MSKKLKKLDFDLQRINKWEAPEKIDEPDARIISMPNVPLPLHTVAPRNILGKQTWDRMRRRCYYEAGYKCEVCGAEVGKDIEKKDYHAHELYSIDYITGESRFIRCVGLCAKCHLLSIHSGRMYTMFKRGNPMMPASKVIDGAEHTFSLVNRWELQHPGEELRLFATWVEMARDKVIGEEITSLIEKYNVRFYGAPKNGASWGEWKLILGGREYPSPFKDEADWREKMEKMNKSDKTSDRNVEDPFKGRVFDAIKEELKKS